MILISRFGERAPGILLLWKMYRATEGRGAIFSKVAHATGPSKRRLRAKTTHFPVSHAPSFVLQVDKLPPALPLSEPTLLTQLEATLFSPKRVPLGTSRENCGKWSEDFRSHSEDMCALRAQLREGKVTNNLPSPLFHVPLKSSNNDDNNG